MRDYAGLGNSTLTAGHARQLPRLDGHYAILWRHQSGVVLPHDLPPGDALVIDDGPVDDMRAEEKSEPSTNDEPMPTSA